MLRVCCIVLVVIDIVLVAVTHMVKELGWDDCLWVLLDLRSRLPTRKMERDPNSRRHNHEKQGNAHQVPMTKQTPRFFLLLILIIFLSTDLMLLSRGSSSG